MQQRSSIAITAAEPIAVPAPTSESKSSVTRFGLVGRQDHGRRAARDHRLERTTVGDPAADVVDQVAQREAVGELVVAAVDDVSGEREDASAGRVLEAELRVLGAAEFEHRRCGRDRLDVVDGGRRRVEARDGGERRLRPRLAALSLERLEQRGLLAADVGAGAAVEDDRDAVEDVLGAHLLERRDEHLVLRLVLTADIDEHVRRLDRMCGDQRALEEAERDAEHDLAVLEGARLGLIGVDHEVVRLRELVRLRDEAPLHPGWEERTAAAPQARGLEFVDHLVGRQCPGPREGLEAADRLVIGDLGQSAAVRPGEDDLRRRHRRPPSVRRRAARPRSPARRFPARGAGDGCRSRRSSPSRSHPGTRQRAG